LAPGDEVQLIIRPEAVQVVAGDPKTDPTLLHATVVSRTFLGEKIEYLVRCEGEMLQIVRYNAGSPALIPVGSTVCVRLAAEVVTVLAGGQPSVGSGQ